MKRRSRATGFAVFFLGRPPPLLVMPLTALASQTMGDSILVGTLNSGPRVSHMSEVEAAASLCFQSPSCCSNIGFLKGSNRGCPHHTLVAANVALSDTS